MGASYPVAKFLTLPGNSPSIKNHRFAGKLALVSSLLGKLS